MRLFRLKLEIGGIGVWIGSMRRDFIDGLKSRYNGFINQGDSNHCLEIFVSHRTRLDPDADLHLTQEEGVYLIHADNFSGRINLKENEASLKMQNNPNAFDPFLRVLYSVILLSNRGFLIHSLGLERGGRGYLFAGPSSSGKSTTARKIKGGRVLSDELTAVRRIEDNFYLFSTPFIGEFDRQSPNIRIPLEKIFFLSRNSSLACLRQTRLETMIKLLGNIFFFAPDLKSNREILNLCHEISSCVPAYEIDVLANKNIGRLIDDSR